MTEAAALEETAAVAGDAAAAAGAVEGAAGAGPHARAGRAGIHEEGPRLARVEAAAAARDCGGPDGVGAAVGDGEGGCVGEGEEEERGEEEEEEMGSHGSRVLGWSFLVRHAGVFIDTFCLTNEVCEREGGRERDTTCISFLAMWCRLIQQGIEGDKQSKIAGDCRKKGNRRKGKRGKDAT